MVALWKIIKLNIYQGFLGRLSLYLESWDNDLEAMAANNLMRLISGLIFFLFLINGKIGWLLAIAEMILSSGRA
jgi:hypothetical protein